MSMTVQKREDARIIKTRAKLFSAFSQLLSEKTFEEITINEICERADVRRATFYKHFNDKYHFLSVLTEYFVEDFKIKSTKESADYNRVEYHISFVRELFYKLIDHENTVDLVIKSNMHTTLINIIMHKVYDSSYVWLKEDVENGHKLIASPEVVAMMLSGGIATILIKWFTSDSRHTPSELMNEIEAIIRAMFAS